MNSRGPLEAQKQAYSGPPKVLGTFSAVLLFFFFAAGCGTGQTERYLHQAADLLAKGNYSLAQEYYSQALELNPRLAAAYLGCGKSYEGLGSLASAVDDYEHALELQPDLEEVKERLIQLLVETGNGRRALDQFASAPPRVLTPSLLLARGRGRMQVELASEAIEDFNSVLEQESQNVSAHYYRGLAHAKLGEFQAAEEDFTAAISLDAGHAGAYWQRGLVREHRGTKELAASDRQKAAELDPRMSFAESQIGKNMIENLTGQTGDDAKLEPFSKETR